MNAAITAFECVLDALCREYPPHTSSSRKQSPALEPLPPSRIVALYGLSHEQCNEAALCREIEEQLHASKVNREGSHCQLSWKFEPLIESTQWLEDPTRLLIVFRDHTGTVVVRVQH